MRLFNNIFQKRESSETSQTSASSATVGGNYGGHEVLVSSQSGALSIAAFYRGCELRANTMSMLVMQYQKKNDKKHGNHYEMDTRGEGDRLNYLLQVQPNPTMTWRQLCIAAELDRIFKGNAYIYIERLDTGEVGNLWLCSQGGYSSQYNKYQITYNSQFGATNLTDVDCNDVIHLRNTFTSDHGLTGISTITYAKQALSLAATNDKLVKDTAAKGGKLKLLLQEEKQNGLGMGRANQKQLEKIATQLNEDLAMDKDVLFLNNIAGVTQYSQNLQQQDISVIRSFSVREIARYLGVPAIMLMDDGGSSYKSPEAATQEFLLRTIAPLSEDWELEMNAKMLGRNGYPTHRYHFDDESLMRLDPAARANYGKVLLETGVKCVNELRAEYDLPAIENGNVHYVSTNLAELGSEKLRSNTTSAQQVQSNSIEGGEKGGEK